MVMLDCTRSTERAALASQTALASFLRAVDDVLETTFLNLQLAGDERQISSSVMRRERADQDPTFLPGTHPRFKQMGGKSVGGRDFQQDWVGGEGDILHGTI